MRCYLFILLLACGSLTWAADSEQRLESVQIEIQALNQDRNKNNASKKELYGQLKQQSRAVSKLHRALVSIEKDLNNKIQTLAQLEQQQSTQQQSQQSQSV